MSEVIHVVDYGAGNIGSVMNMIRRAGGESVASREPARLKDACKILLPGVGSFDNAISKLAALDLIEVLQARARAGVPFLGICLGMQLLADSSEEGQLPGLGLISGRVRRFNLAHLNPAPKVPHMGWNLVRALKRSRLTQGLEAGSRFYFVHSYHFECADMTDRLLESEHGHPFTSGVERGNVMGVQFHPEKSHRFGMTLLRNFVGL